MNQLQNKLRTSVYLQKQKENMTSIKKHLFEKTEETKKSAIKSIFNDSQSNKELFLLSLLNKEYNINLSTFKEGVDVSGLIKRYLNNPSDENESALIDSLSKLSKERLETIFLSYLKEKIKTMQDNEMAIL